MKSASLIILTTIVLHLTTLYGNNLLVLTNPIIKSIDGVPYMLDGEAIMKIVGILRNIVSIHNGQKTNGGQIGNYEYKHELMSVAQLAQQEELDPNNKQLKQILIIAKNDFIKITKPFINDIEPAKRLVLSLLQEYCDRRNRKDSMILLWAQAKRGREIQIFNTSIQSLRELDTFLKDLTLFLKDLINSCPKACEQYKEWYNKNKSVDVFNYQNH